MVLELIVTILEIFTDPIKEYIVTPLKNHISYAFTCDGKVERLHHEVEKLRNKRVRLQQSVDAATRSGEEIYPNVTEWLISAEKDIEEAQKLIQGKEEAKKKCCSGFSPNLKTRYQLSKKSHKKALAMDEQLQSEEGLHPISFRPPLQPIVEPSVYSCEALPSRLRILNQIMDALKDPNLNMIGVHGMGGVGKSTLVKEVQGQALNENLFETVIKVSISEKPDLRKIQGEIAGFLNLPLNAEEILGRASELHQRLKKDKVLIILDDVWKKLDLTAVGIPFGDASEGCKILLTSRKKDVLSNEMRTQKEFPLDVLKEEETRRLFEMSVSMANDPELRALAIEIANKCAGLPLLIDKVAADLRNKGLHAWKDMLAQLSSLENTEIYEKVHKVIESSYEKLIDEEAKSLFLLCALFGNSNIQIQDLLIYCMGLGLFKCMDSIAGSRNRVLTLIDKLKNERLLLDGDMAGFVKIHDVFRDIATAIASRVNYTFVGKGQIRSTDLESKVCTRISLPYCDIHQLPEVLRCPEAEVFSVFAEDLSLDIPASFFEGVTQLKVLHFTGVSFVSGLPPSPDSEDSGLVYFFSGLPSSLSFLTGLQTLSLDGCRLNDVGMVAELKQLKFLSFAGSNIAELPREIKALTRLKLLDLTGCDDLEVIPSNVLSNLSLLEELYMLGSFMGWDTEGNARLVELKNLSRLTTLEIRVQDDKLLPEDWFFNGIQNYKISIGNWHWFDAEEASRMLKLELKTSIGLMDRIKEFLGGTEALCLREVNGIEKIDSSWNLRFLNIQICNSLREVLPFSSEKCLLRLQEIEVQSCDNMEAIVGEGNEGEVMEFAQLASLKLWFLPNLRGICKTSGTVSFPNLTNLEIYNCNSLKYVFTTSMVKSLQQFKKLEVSQCESMEEIILVTEDSINMIVFPQLDFLHLHELPNLKRFSSGYPVQFPKVRELKIESCHEMNNFVSKDSDRSNNNGSTDEYLFNELVTFRSLEIICFGYMDNFRYLWHPQFADNDSFSKLKTLDIQFCSMLSVVFPSNACRRFRRLESLDVFCCPDVKHVFLESLACGLLQLQHLKIEECGVEMIIAEGKNEGSEGATTRTFEWPKLKSLIINDCDKLIKFSSNISKAKHKIPTQGLVSFVEKVIPNVEVLTLDCHSLKAIQSDDHGFPVESLWKLKEVTMVNLKEESVPILFDFLRQIYSVEKLTFDKGCLGEIFSLDDERATGDQQQQYNLGLKHLDLDGVSKLKHIVKEDSQLNPIFQCFHILSVKQCNDMMNISPSSISFKNLTILHVYWCEKMTSLVTASTAKSMIQLKELKVDSCDMMEYIVANDGGDCTEDHDDDVITFNKLQNLTLCGLPSLNSFCSGNYIFNFPLLEDVSIQECNQMKIFCGGVLSTPKLQWEGNLNDVIAQQSGSAYHSEDGDSSSEM